MLLYCGQKRSDGKDYAQIEQTGNKVGLLRNTSRPMRKMIVEIYINRTPLSWVSRLSPDSPSDFLYGLTLRLVNVRTRPVVDHTKTGDASRDMEADGKIDS
ncbi:hypothetical protein BDU57DRAFT_508868 [Ampelomyces quisqualis]|uniref:Uncharacterized protein n=1 Tax=Ampelomyces quisqualis TaxID=50730 RepID=A0A6A5R089_AMPQU|nr:hypothetical protein BDU57DRAFT_508868 [Ampelomyces quisqualis]